MQEIFEPYDRLIEITLLGEKKLVPENNTILRCLQYLDMDKISEADYMKAHAEADAAYAKAVQVLIEELKKQG